MNKKTIIFLLISLCMAFVTANGQMSLIMNGSFEKNADYIDDISVEPPIYWCDVNIPSPQFSGWVDIVGSIHGDYALTLSSNIEDMTQGDKAVVGQQVFIESDVASISFSLQLSSGWPNYFPWHADERTFYVTLDGQEIWNSDGLEIVDGSYSGVVEIPQADFIDFCDDSLHTLEFWLRVNQPGEPDIEFYADVDFVKFDKYCGGLGYLSSDLNYDCYIDQMDLMLLAEEWLKPADVKRLDLYEDGSIDFYDIAVLAQDWLYNSDWSKWGQENTYQVELLDLDLDLSGQVDAGELAILNENWLSEQSSCSAVDQGPDKDGIIDFKDFAVFADQWGDKDWIYYLDTD